MDDTNVPNRAPKLLGTLIVFLVLSTVVVGLRVYCRACVLKVFGREDWLAIIAVIVNFGYSTLTVLSLEKGYGKHLKDVPLQSYEGLLKLAYATSFACALAPCTVKLSVLALYYGLSVEPSHRRCIKITSWVVIIYTIILLFVSIFMCYPISKAWDVLHYPSGCPLRLNDILAIQAGCNLVGSVVIYCMPLPVIYAINIPRRDKITIVLMLLFGGIAVVASILRLKWLLDFNWENYDFTWEATTSGLYAIIECNLTLITTSLFAVRQLIIRGKRALTSPPPPPPPPLPPPLHSRLHSQTIPPDFLVEMEMFSRKNTNSDSTDQIVAATRDSRSGRNDSI
ncbi:hypothetical protein BZA05DRAFT_403127, partial [Tricharina praecox]|uniref:uncharacterized protein n=1 Tax=Tricharina praecox TaxID=43433 RepID=UPI002220E862